jgi:two-component system cell cycle sensor histidine kinase/response regulator CckA
VTFTALDITERKRAEEALRENQARLDLALQSAHMGVWRWEIRENRRYFDELTCQLLGVEAATFTGTAEEFFRMVHPEDREKIKAALAWTLEQDVPYEPTYRVVWPDGSVRYITARGRLFRDDKGQPARINGILWDITDQRLMEQEHIKTQKLESIGMLAGGIAHDFNNLLQGIFGYISMAKMTLGQREKSQAMLEQAEKALHQSVNLTTQLLTFSKGGKPVKKLIDLRPVIENSTKFTLSGSRCDFLLNIPEDLWQVEADEGQLGQVIQNIVLNADQAMPVGGTVMVFAANRAEGDASLPPGLAKRDYVVMAIQDTGVGIPAQYLSKIFDPYFTTKEKGSGLGLATSYSIVRNHGGMIDVKTKSGDGSTFMIYLPAIAEGARAEAAVEPAKRSLSRTARVLVMDDEELIRNLSSELLGVLGHDVEVAKHGQEALEKYQGAMAEGKPFDIVILDLTIRGGMGGAETIQKLLEIDPALKAIVSSGYSDDDVTANFEKQGFKAFLKKPYDADDLSKVINEMFTI